MAKTTTFNIIAYQNANFIRRSHTFIQPLLTMMSQHKPLPAKKEGRRKNKDHEEEIG
jgi:hypothetical protein